MSWKLYQVVCTSPCQRPCLSSWSPLCHGRRACNSRFRCYPGENKTLYYINETKSKTTQMNNKFSYFTKANFFCLITKEKYLIIILWKILEHVCTNEGQFCNFLQYIKRKFQFHTWCLGTMAASPSGSMSISSWLPSTDMFWPNAQVKKKPRISEMQKKKKKQI